MFFHARNRRPPPVYLAVVAGVGRRRHLVCLVPFDPVGLQVLEIEGRRCISNWLLKTHDLWVNGPSGIVAAFAGAPLAT